MSGLMFPAASLLQQLLGALGGGALAAIAVASLRARSRELGIRTAHERGLLEHAMLRIDSLERQLAAEQEARRKDRARCDQEIAALDGQVRGLERQLLQLQLSTGRMLPLLPELPPHIAAAGARAEAALEG